MYCSGLDRGRAGLLLSLLSMFFVRRKAGRQRPAGRLLPSVCCLPNEGVLASGGNKHLVVVYMLVVVCQFSCAQKACLVIIIVALPDPYLGQNSTRTGHKMVATALEYFAGIQAKFPSVNNDPFPSPAFGNNWKSKKTKSRPLTKAISTRNSIATRHYLQWHGTLFANQEACLTPTLETLMS